MSMSYMHEHLTQRQTTLNWQIVTMVFSLWSGSVYQERENKDSLHIDLSITEMCSVKWCLQHSVSGVCAQREMLEKSIIWLIQILNIKDNKYIHNIMEGCQGREVRCNKEQLSSSSHPGACKIKHTTCVDLLLKNPSFCSGPRHPQHKLLAQHSSISAFSHR